MPISYFDEAGTQIQLSYGFIAKHGYVYEEYIDSDGSLKTTPIVFDIKVGTQVQVLGKKSGSNYCLIKFRGSDGDYKTGYIHYTCVDTTYALLYNEQERLFTPLTESGCYHEGSQGDQILYLNFCLNRYFDSKSNHPSPSAFSYYHVPVTTEYTAKTKEYVMKFQEENHLIVDGFAGNKTLELLENWIRDDNGKG